MKYSYNNIMEPWYLEEFKIIDMEPIRKNYYAISNYGRVMNIKTHKLINTFQGSGGYYRVSLNNEDKTRTTYQVHILVALHFIPRTHDDIINNRNIVNHKNLLTFVNYVHNLEWVNISENAAHSHQYRHLKLTSAVSKIKNNPWPDTKGSKNGMSKLTEDQVHKMCQLLEKGYSYSDICNITGLEDTDNNRHLLSNIVRGKRWTHISKNYNLPKPQQCTNFSMYAIPVCELLEERKSNKEIVDILGMNTPGDSSYRFINRLRNRKIYHEITKNYNF